MEIYTVYWIQLISIILKYNEAKIKINKIHVALFNVVNLLIITFESLLENLNLVIQLGESN